MENSRVDVLEHTVLIRERSFYINVERSLSLFHPTHPSWPYTGQKQLHSLHSYIHYPSQQQTMMDPFKSHLVALLSIYKLGPFPGTPIPCYEFEGPTDWQLNLFLNCLVRWLVGCVLQRRLLGIYVNNW